MTTVERLLAAGRRTTATSWKRSITGTACAVIPPPEITMHTVYVLKHITDNM